MDQVQGDILLTGDFLDLFHIVLIQFVPLVQGNDVMHPGANVRILLQEPVNQFQRILDAFSAYDPGRLNDKQVILPKPQILPKTGVVLIELRGIIEVFAVGYHMGVHPLQRT